MNAVEQLLNDVTVSKRLGDYIGPSTVNDVRQYARLRQKERATGKTSRSRANLAYQIADQLAVVLSLIEKDLAADR